MLSNCQAAASLSTKAATFMESLKTEKEHPSLPWHSPIPFHIVDEVTKQTVLVPDILEYCANPLLKGTLLRFSPSTYTLDPTGMNLLRDDLKKAARANGVAISTAWSRVKTGSICFRCQHGQVYSNSQKDDAAAATAVATSANDNDDEDENDATNHNHTSNNNHKPKKKKQTRRKLSNRRPTKDAVGCPFSLSISQDDQSFLVRGGTGTLYHQHHHRFDPKTSTVLPHPSTITSGPPPTTKSLQNDDCHDDNDNDDDDANMYAFGLDDHDDHDDLPRGPLQQQRITTHAASQYPEQSRAANEINRDDRALQAYHLLNPKLWEFCNALDGSETQSHLLERASRLLDILGIEAKSYAHVPTTNVSDPRVVGQRHCNNQPTSNKRRKTTKC